MTTTLDWTKLRQHQGSVAKAFEALCCLLAEHGPDEAERVDFGWRFYRKGTPDAGCGFFDASIRELAISI